MSDDERDALLVALTNAVTVLGIAAKNGYNFTGPALGSALHAIAAASEPLGNKGVTKQAKDVANTMLKQR